ncbi:MAG: FixH family protein [Chitinophagaceae bacterium]|nr:FixH family protein [Chitinophagaceae bacterium]
MNWGYKILIVYLVFVAGIIVLVFKSSNEKIDLVTPDYYAKELKHQEKIDAVKRTNALASKVKFEIVNNSLIITLPAEFNEKEVSGEVLLYCPSDGNKDIKKNFTTTNSATTVALSPGIKGAYDLQLNWNTGSRTYYFEEKLFL